jgi:uncharacterized membrane protein (DUF373 family)
MTREMDDRHVEVDNARRPRVLTFYEKFEHGVVLILTGVIAAVIVATLWSLILRVADSIVVPARSFDPTDHTVFQAIFGMIFTVLIALEFKRSLLVLAERKEGIVQVRTVILIALLAIVRKLIIFDFAVGDWRELLALAAVVLALGGVHWLVRDQDRRTSS